MGQSQNKRRACGPVRQMPPAAPCLRKAAPQPMNIGQGEPAHLSGFLVFGLPLRPVGMGTQRAPQMVWRHGQDVGTDLPCREAPKCKRRYIRMRIRKIGQEGAGKASEAFTIQRITSIYMYLILSNVSHFWIHKSIIPPSLHHFLCFLSKSDLWSTFYVGVIGSDRFGLSVNFG